MTLYLQIFFFTTSHHAYYRIISKEFQFYYGLSLEGSHLKCSPGGESYPKLYTPGKKKRLLVNNLQAST